MHLSLDLQGSDNCSSQTEYAGDDHVLKLGCGLERPRETIRVLTYPTHRTLKSGLE
jgi:hypothetical protein